MKITVPMAGGIIVGFDSIKEVGEHYGHIANGYHAKAHAIGTTQQDKERYIGMAAAYSSVAWQLQHEKCEISE